MRDDDDVVRVFGNGVAIVAGRCEQGEGSREGVAVLPGDGCGDAVHREIDHGRGAGFRRFPVVTLDLFKGALDEAFVVGSQGPVGIFSGKPQLCVMQLDGCHQFAHARLIHRGYS